MDRGTILDKMQPFDCFVYNCTATRYIRRHSSMYYYTICRERYRAVHFVSVEYYFQME